MSNNLTKKKTIRITVESTQSTTDTVHKSNTTDNVQVTQEGAARRRRRI